MSWVYRLPGILILILILILSPNLVANSVRVATLNLENYLDVHRVVDGTFRPEYPKPESEKKALRKVIIKIAPQVLAIQEMGSKAHLREFQQDLRSEGLDFPYLVLMESSDEDRHTAVLSQLPFLEVIRHRALKYPYFEEISVVKRGLLEVHFESNGSEWVLFNVHLKSRLTKEERDPESKIRRTREATAIRNMIVERGKEPGLKRFLVTGDFNDSVHSATLRRFTRIGEREISRNVPAMDSRGEVWTYFYGKEETYSRVDYFLVSPALWPHLEKSKGVVVDSPDMLSGSDHRMVYIDLMF